MRLCFATSNAGKLKEVQELIDKNIDLVSLTDIGCLEEIPEDKDTIEANSIEKASYVWEKYKVNCFADDTGLEVEALNGAPGVYSARYAGKEANAENNMLLLLKNMKGKQNRQAQFKTCITLIIDGKIKTFTGIASGKIIEDKRGAQGFGYDPIFIPDNHDITFAEMSSEIKNKISHRAKAMTQLIQYLNKHKF